MTWSPFRADVMADPGTGHDELLERAPVHLCEAFDPPFYTLSRYADVEAALRDVETFSSQHGQGPRFTPPQGMLADPPQHTEMRRLVQGAFGPRAMARLRTRVEAVTRQLIDDIEAGPVEFDLHDALGFPLPVIIIAEMLGVPESDLERFKRWSDIQVAAMGAEDPREYAAPQAEFFAYMSERMAERRVRVESGNDVADDLMSAVAASRTADGARIDMSDALSIVMQLLVGGNETTTSLITNVVWRLLERGHWQDLAAEPARIPAAIEESLRFDPPVLGLYRNTTKTVRLHDVTIPAGSKVYLYYAAANRDPRVFQNPHHFDLSRPRTRRHLGFGLGIHMCLGAPMARLETEIVLRALLERFPTLTLVDRGTRITPFFLWGRRTLTVRRT